MYNSDWLYITLMNSFQIPTTPVVEPHELHDGSVSLQQFQLRSFSLGVQPVVQPKGYGQRPNIWNF